MSAATANTHIGATPPAVRLSQWSFGVFAALAVMSVASSGSHAQSDDDRRTVSALSRQCATSDFSMACGALLALDMDRMPRRKALTRARRACDGGSPLACTALGLLLAPADQTAAQAAFARACDGGEPAGCYNLAALRWRSADPLVRGTALPLFHDGCEREFAAACTALGDAFARGDGVARAPIEARRYYRTGCESGDARGCALLAEEHRQSGGWPRAAQLFEKACSGGDAFACLRSGFALEDGRGVTADPARAAAAYRRACDGGHGDGCTSLGFLLLEYSDSDSDLGRGVKANRRRARELFDRGCYLARASTAGCVVYGDMLRDGVGGPRDPRAAVRTYDRACTEGEGLGCARLADAFAAGRGIRRSAELARRFSARACTLGHAEACRQNEP